MAGSNSGSYRDLIVWQRAIEVVDEVYRLTKYFPDDERYGLTNQVRRAAVSVPSNIAEGYGCQSRQRYVNHLRMANGSLKEVETQIIIAGRLGYVDRDSAKTLWDLLQEVGKMLNALIKSLKPIS